MTLARQFLVVAVAVAGASLAASAQQKAKPWTQVRTTWGDPDLQGTWTNETITPFERPTNLASKPFLTPAEAAALEARAAGQRDSADDAPARAGDVGSYNQAWFDSGTTRRQRRTNRRRTAADADGPASAHGHRTGRRSGIAARTASRSERAECRLGRILRRRTRATETSDCHFGNSQSATCRAASVARAVV